MPVESGSQQEVRAAADLLFRRRAAQLTATLTRILGVGQLDLVEDVVQDAFVRALRIWPTAGIPSNPAAWILTVAKNRALDIVRRDRRWNDKRSEIEASILPDTAGYDVPRAYFSTEVDDDELRLIFATCHPALSRDAQVALTLKTARGFGTAEVARAFLSTTPTIAQRIVRAKRGLRDAAVVLEIPSGAALGPRLGSVLEVLYLMFNEGYSVTAGDSLIRSDLCAEAIRLGEKLAGHDRVGGPVVHALLALFLFQAARLPARTSSTGELVPLENQDRRCWNRRIIRRALEHHRLSADGGEMTGYHLQAEIASCHTLALDFQSTDWDRILACYDELLARAPSPVVALNRVVAEAQVHGPNVALAALEPLKAEPSLQSYHRLFAVEAELLWRSGQAGAAAEAVSTAISLASSEPVVGHLERRKREYVSVAD